jgi:hypothetical protein
MPTHPHTASGDPPERRNSAPAMGEPTEKHDGIFRRLWRGQLPLWDAFWTYYVLGQVLAYFVGATIGPTIAALFAEEHALILIGIFTLLVPVLYQVFAGVGVWRSASGRGVLGILARVIVCVELSAWLFAFGGLFYAAVRGPLPTN